MNLLLVPLVAGLLAVVTADTNDFGSSETYVVTGGSHHKSEPSSYSSSSVGFSERSDNSQQLSSHDGAQSYQPSSYSSLFETTGVPLGFGTPRPYSNFRRNDLQAPGFGSLGVLQAGASPAGSISNFLGGYPSGAQGLGADYGLQQGGLGGLFGSQQQAFNPYQMQQFQSQFGGLGGQGFSQLQQPLQFGSGAEAFSRYALPGQGFQGSAFSDLGQQGGLLSGAQIISGGKNIQSTAQLPFDVQQVLRQAASMQQPFFTPRGTQAFGGGFGQLQPHFGGALGGFGDGSGGGGFGGGGRGSSSNSGRGGSRGRGSSVTSRLFAPLTQLASSLYGSSDDDTKRADSSQRTRGGFFGRGSQG